MARKDAGHRSQIMALQDNLQICLEFDEGTGTTANDSSGNGNGTLVNGVGWTSGKLGAAVEFDGTNDYVTTNVGAPLRSGETNDLTWATWLWIDATGRNDFIVWKTANGTDDIGIFTDADTKVAVFARINSSAGSIITGATTLSINTWYHVALTKSGDSWTLYLNAVSDGSATAARTLASHDTDVLWLGSNHTNFSPLAANNLDGRLDQFAAWNRALSGSEISDLYNGGSGRRIIFPPWFKRRRN